MLGLTKSHGWAQTEGGDYEIRIQKGMDTGGH